MLRLFLIFGALHGTLAVFESLFRLFIKLFVFLKGLFSLLGFLNRFSHFDGFLSVGRLSSNVETFSLLGEVLDWFVSLLGKFFSPGCNGKDLGSVVGFVRLLVRRFSLLLRLFSFLPDFFGHLLSLFVFLAEFLGHFEALFGFLNLNLRSFFVRPACFLFKLSRRLDRLRGLFSFGLAGCRDKLLSLLRELFPLIHSRIGFEPFILVFEEVGRLNLVGNGFGFGGLLGLFRIVDDEAVRVVHVRGSFGKRVFVVVVEGAGA